MRLPAAILGILAAVPGLYQGISWLVDFQSRAARSYADALHAAGEGDPVTAAWALVACGAVALAVSVLILLGKGNRWVLAALLVFCGPLPLVFFSRATFGLGITAAGLLAFAVRDEPE